MTDILVIDDEAQIRRALRTGLQARAYSVAEAATGEDGIAAAAAIQPALIVLDMGLPDLDGVAVIGRVRAWSQVPIIILSVRDAQADKIHALEAGADDYITKPFDMEELVARIRATLRRAQSDEPADPALTYGDLTIDLDKKLVRHLGDAVHLTPTEYTLLETMATRPGKLLTHQWLLQQVWGTGYQRQTHYLHVYVGQLRRKLHDDRGIPQYIVTEPGIGYRWTHTALPPPGSAP